MNSYYANYQTGPGNVRVMVVEPDPRFRNHMTLEYAMLGAEMLESPDDLVPLIGTGSPTVAIFGPSFASDIGLAFLEQMTPQYPELGVILVADDLSVALLQRALRAGVRDAVPSNIDEDALLDTVARVAGTLSTMVSRVAPPVDTGIDGKVICVFSTKGGVGKSVTSTNLATALAMRGGPSVAIVDADLQFGDVAVLLGIPPQHTTLEAANSVFEADERMMDGYLGRHPQTGLRVLPAPIEPSAADAIGPEQMLAIAKMLRRMYNFTVIDMPPHFDDTVVALLEEADDVILVASMDIPSIKNLKLGLQTLNVLAIAGEKLHLLLNRANAKVNLDIADVGRAVGIPAEFLVPSDIAVPQAVNRGVPVVLDKPKSPAALAYQSLADSFAGRIEVEEPAEVKSGSSRWSLRRDRDGAKQ